MKLDERIIDAASWLKLKGKYETALVTGGAGFIGSHLVDYLVAGGLTVCVVDDFSAGSPNNLLSAQSMDSPSNLTRMWIKDIDVSDRSAMPEVMSIHKPDIIFHLAASKKNICLKDPIRDCEVNAIGTLSLCTMAAEFGVKKFIHASTGSVYGEPRVSPQTEGHPCVPVSNYGISKYAGESYVKTFLRNGSLDGTILRLFHVYGPRQNNTDDLGGVIAIFIRRLMAGLPLIVYGDGSQTRSFTYVDDVVNAMLFAAQKDECNGEVYNVASGYSVTLNQMIELLQSLTQRRAEIVNKDWQIGDIIKFDVSNKKITALGCEFRITLTEGLCRTIYADTGFEPHRSHSSSESGISSSADGSSPKESH